MKRSLSWSHWPGSHWNGSTPIKSELCGFPSTCLQVRKINTNLLNLSLSICNPSWVHSPILHLGEVPCSFTLLRWFLDIRNQHVAFYVGFGCQLPPSVWILGGSAKWPRLLFVKVVLSALTWVLAQIQESNHDRHSSDSYLDPMCDNPLKKYFVVTYSCSYSDITPTIHAGYVF